MSERYLEAARAVALRAGAVLSARRSEAIGRTKGDAGGAAGVVSDADEAAEHLIREALGSAFSDHGIYGEEGGWSGAGETAEFTWYVDPLDGTSNYLRGIPLYGVSIGLLRAGRPALGVLHFPALDLMVWGGEVFGAFANARRINVSRRPLSEALYYAGGMYRGRSQVAPGLATAARFVKVIDASSYELAQIAMGDAEVYYLTNVPHDVVAGIAIVLAAGGQATDSLGRPWTIAAKEVLVTNGACHAAALDVLGEGRIHNGSSGQ